VGAVDAFEGFAKNQHLAGSTEPKPLGHGFSRTNADRATGYCSGLGHVLSFGWNFVSRFGVLKYMQREWTLRQILATVRGIGVMVGLFWLLVAVQFVPAWWRGGLGGVREQMVRIAVTGVAQDHWQIAVMRMDQALGIMGALGCALFLLQRYLGRKLSTRQTSQRC